MMPSSPTTFRLLLMVTLAIWAQADGEENTCAENGGTCVAEDENCCAHEADYPGCGENEMCCVSSGRFVKRQNDIGCEFNGTYYNRGDTIPGICIDMTCSRNYTWVTNHTFNQNCSVCNVYNDPHFKTFDGHLYDWHGLCNYSISQLGYSYNAPFGIYGQFQECQDGYSFPSCLSITTFKDDPNTVINILYNAGPNVEVNGNPYTLMSTPHHIVAGYWPGGFWPVWHQVIAWRPEGWTPDENCNFFLGTQGYLLATCRVQLFVWAYPNLMNQINSLCGHFDDDPLYDFVARNGVIYPEPTPAFARSWEEDPCEAGDRLGYAQTCASLFGDVEKEYPTSSRDPTDISLYGCVIDLCLMEQNGSNQTTIDEWKRVMQNMYLQRIIIDNNTN